MFCPECGHHQVSNDMRFCSRCGLPLDVVTDLLANGGNQLQREKREITGIGLMMTAVLLLINFTIVFGSIALPHLANPVFLWIWVSFVIGSLLISGFGLANLIRGGFFKRLKERERRLQLMNERQKLPEEGKRESFDVEAVPRLVEPVSVTETTTRELGGPVNTDARLLLGTEPGAIATGSKSQLCHDAQITVLTRMLKTSFLIIVLGACISGNPICAQSGQSAKPQVYGARDGLTGDDCEGIMMRLDFLAIAADESAKDQTIIIIARLGSGEISRSLSRSRLKQVADYLHRRVVRERIVSAEGARVKGLGQLEFYVAGKLHSIFKVRRNRDLVRGCG